VERYKKQNERPPIISLPNAHFGLSEIISLPTSTGIRFIDKNSILLFECNCDNLFEKKCWKAILTDRIQLKLRTSTSANDILSFMGSSKFMRINPSCIVNINFLAAIEFSTRTCQLLPPFNDIQIIASRSNMSEIRERFDVL
jgi:two-component system LytT family response regulator